MAWEPMTPEEARKLLDAIPAAGTMSADQFARFVEARMVDQGAPPERIRVAVESVLGHPVD